MEEMVRLRKADIAAGDLRTDDSTFLGALVLKSEEVRREEESGKGGEAGAGSIKGASLSNDELYGNLFTYNLAGHETTANTLSFAIYLLAAFPGWQEWVSEEVDLVCGVAGDGPVKTAGPDGKGFTYLPWSAGSRVCPGKKFSQVEVLGVLSGILRGHRVEVVPEGVETGEQARRRCAGVVEDSETQITLQMRRADRVRLRVVKREGIGLEERENHG